MNRSAKFAAGASVLVVAGLFALAAPALASVGAATAERVSDGQVATGSTVTEVETDTDLAAARDEEPHPTEMNDPSRWAPGCTQNSVMTAEGTLRGAPELVDTGASEFASGTVTLDDEGRIATYAVAAGDAPSAIGERFCVDYITVFQYNDIYPTFSVQPGDILSLLPAGNTN